MELPAVALAAFSAESFADLTAAQADEFCRSQDLDWDLSFVAWNSSRITDAGVRAAHCPVRTETFHSCCAWREDAVSPIAGQEVGDCRYDPVEQEQLLKSFGVFAGAFIMRPVGGVVMGLIGDQWGRKFALQVSIALMLLPSLLLAALPTYADIGFFATAGLLIIRLCQGVAAGGELVGSMLYTVESAPRSKRGMFGAAAFSFSLFGNLLGNAGKAVTYYILDPEPAAAWGWRACYVAGFGLGLVGIQLRKGLEESPEFERAKKELAGSNVAPENPLKEAFTKYHKEVLTVMCSVAIWCCGFYTFMIWIGTYYGSEAAPAPSFRPRPLASVSRLAITRPRHFCSGDSSPPKLKSLCCCCCRQ